MNHPTRTRTAAVDLARSSRSTSAAPGPLRLEGSALGMLAGWVATWSWSGMVVQPSGFLVPGLLIGALVVLAGAGLRRLPAVPAYAVAGGQVLVALVGLNAAVAGSLSVAGVLPTVGSSRTTVQAVLDGSATLNHYSAPVSVNVHDAHALLLAAALGVLLVVELLITWWRRPAAVALPLLVSLAVPVSVLEDALALPVFVGTALLFIRLLGTRLTKDPAEGLGEDRTLGVLWEVGVAAVLVALLLSPVIPVTNLLARAPTQSASGVGNGNDYTVASVNPFVRLRRDLVARTHTPMVYARTAAPRTSYLRTTVLDLFTPGGWEASTRRLPASNVADGPFPSPPGLEPDRQVGRGVVLDQSTTPRHHTWQLELAPHYLTTWLPLPYPLRSVHVDGDWRYDDRTLDVTTLSPVATSGLSYRADAFDPDIDARSLKDAIGPPPASVQVPNTQVPRDIPPIIERQARTVTRGASTNFERAVALQEWFRSRGGFTYSLGQRPGSGLDLLAHFVTDDRVGYCEQYAAAMAAMGRTLGIPSRVVVGFLDGTIQPDGRVLYTSDDRHAWPEMFFSGVGWVRFEPTPSERAGASPPWTRQDLSAGARRAPETRARRAPVPARTQDTTADNGAEPGVPWEPLAAIVVVGVLGALPAGVRRVQRRRRLGGTEADRLLEGAWAELRATAVDLGVDWPEDRSPREQAWELGEQVPGARRRIREPVGNLLVAVERSRYGPPVSEPLTAAQRQHTLKSLAQVRKALLDGTRKKRGWWSRCWPASVWPASWRRTRGAGSHRPVREPTRSR